MRALALILLLLTSCARQREAPKPQAQFADPKTCAGCHAEIARTYKETGMGRSFFRATPANMAAENWEAPAIHHGPSARSYRMIRRDGKYFLRRWQRGPDGKEANAHEIEIQWVMGSGNHVRSYLHQTPQGRLAELPVAWYAEKGGYFAMSPGYDRPDHQEWRRKVSTDCMFCHNAYPAQDRMPEPEPVFATTADPIPEGIDCQRCHGPGRAHTEAAGNAASSKEAIRASVVNPARLSRDRSLEVCMQCHLETTSFPLPNSLIRFGRGAFSYRPGEPLSDFVLHFDHAAGSGRGAKFEIVNSVYRLRQSKCFTASDRLQCITCHNPHQSSKSSPSRYEAACRQCHAELPAAHTKQPGCVTCHMPKRRTEDVVHAVMTDHKIQRRPPPGDLLAPLAERHEKPGEGYKGEVVPYYPREFPPDLRGYLALAQVAQRSNLRAGIEALAAAREPGFRMGLAEAHAAGGSRELAIAAYRDALAQNPRSVPALRNLGELLRETGKLPEALEALEAARNLDPANSSVRHALGLTYKVAGRPGDARAAFEKAVEADPDHAEAHNALGAALLDSGEASRALSPLRQAILHKPDFAEARTNLGNVLLASGDFGEAEFQHREAVRLAPASAGARFGLAGALLRRERLAEARRELESAVRFKPEFAEALVALGELEAAEANWGRAIAHYRQAVRLRPGLHRAHLGLGSALAAAGNAGEAREHLVKAGESGDAAIRAEAAQVLQMLSRPPSRGPL